MMAKICIVIAYFERQNQLNKTLESFKQYNPEDFNVIIIDNASKDDIILPKLPYNIKVIKITDKSLDQCVISYNTGFHEALKSNPEFIVINGAECCHKGDILSSVKGIADNEYRTFGCYSLAENETPENVVINNRDAMYDFDSAWYNHPIYRPVAYNFCSAMMTKNLVKLNGFDERFLGGCGYEDNYFLHQIAILGLKINIIADPFVFHQCHKTAGDRGAEACNKNSNLYAELVKNNTFRAVHTITPDLI